MRELARGIHPAVLTERGLSAAIGALATRSPVPVEVLDPSSDRLPAAVEATAYFTVAEALTNVAKYAQATYATVSVQQMGGELVIEVRDDGVGGAQVGTGSASADWPTASVRLTAHSRSSAPRARVGVFAPYFAQRRR